jgi:hypothetical protein
MSIGAPPDEPAISGHDVTCAFCGHPNPADSHFCRSCGRGLRDLPAVAEDTARQRATAEHPLDSAPLRHAAPPVSTALPLEPAGTPSTPGQGPSTSLLIVLTLALAVAGVGTVLLVRSGQSSHRASSSPTALESTRTITEAASTPPPAQSATQPAGAPAPARTGESTFHVPSGNVTCEVSPRLARCAVSPTHETFVLPSDGRAAFTEPGLTLAPKSGTLTKYGESVASGAITCHVPRSTERRGITCESSATGHGFEASQVPARKRLF